MCYLQLFQNCKELVCSLSQCWVIECDRLPSKQTNQQTQGKDRATQALLSWSWAWVEQLGQLRLLSSGLKLGPVLINTKKVIIFGQVLKRMSNVDESQIRRARMINTSYAKIVLQVMVDRVKLSLRVYQWYANYALTRVSKTRLNTNS